MRILIVEDDPEIGDLLADALRAEGWKPMVRTDGAAGLQAAEEHPFAVILLDVMMPKMDGWEVCASLRRQGIDTPVLMLTARDAVTDRVKGLDLGADDYLVKPFELDELKARIRALARREAHHKSSTLVVADLEIDSRGQSASRNGKPLNLTPREFSLLEALARNEGIVLTREAILERVFQAEDALPNTVSFHMASLRKKLDATAGPRLIHTVHGVGYVFRRDDP